ncbi:MULTISPECIES: dihydrolipoamide acetyltransferase family protein [unclassified Pseudonocardia]|uniref:dihydrolipoamide acetyltransferase family protein n=1 Tax=unclassified Pseudonocardia TaxID=2619320 RepID=UPI0009593CAE|nr:MULTISPECIES: dihydrolipoamide acetyltransferase family protein [unclassified Pseudonocardia]MBN9098897.1 2-oxo acid dehydrogenase subunit E2 [Pseudonocardia sp.]OJY40707.1 MAG: branched-chain alpha-keto acid dehydrogenase subunit E2 [Pseudonocardia sp. 73-21]
MLREFAMPDVGEGLTEAEVVTWNVNPGDTVTVNQIICEIETAKAAVELPCPYAGTVVDLLVKTGETVAVGSPIIAIETAEAAPAPAPAAPVDDEKGAKIGEAGKDGRIATLVGYGPRPGSVTRRPRRGAAAPAAGDQASGTADRAPSGSASPGGDHGQMAPAAVAPDGDRRSGTVDRASHDSASPSVDHDRVGAAAPGGDQRSGTASRPPSGPASPNGDHGLVPLAKPPVRKLARDLGVDLRTVVPSGAGGVITREDVHAHVAAPEPVAAPVASGGVRREPIRGVRKATAAAVVSSAFTAPHVTEFLAVDITATMDLRERLRATREYSDVKLTPLAFVAKAVCLAARRTPEVNAHWDEAAGEIVYYDRVQLGIAAATPRGLIVPKVRDADTLTLRELAGALGGLTATARSGKTPPADLMGGTFTITNVGVFGVDTGTPIINPGEAAILAVGAIKPTPWVVDGELAVRTVCQLALSFDHRLVDGEQGSRFLADVGALLTDPGLALTW